MKPVVHSAAAESDIRYATEYYRHEAGPEVATAFIDFLEQATHQACAWPGAGSPQIAETLGIPGLRSLALAQFPYAIFYVDHPTHVDVWRVLHVGRDIPATLRTSLP